MRRFFEEHECLRRALRTFLQTAGGVLTAAVVNADGRVESVGWQAVIVLAVATGLAALMNLGGGADADC